MQLQTTASRGRRPLGSVFLEPRRRAIPAYCLPGRVIASFQARIFPTLLFLSCPSLVSSCVSAVNWPSKIVHGTWRRDCWRSFATKAECSQPLYCAALEETRSFQVFQLKIWILYQSPLLSVTEYNKAKRSCSYDQIQISRQYLGQFQQTLNNPVTPNRYNYAYVLFLFLRSNCCIKS